jgi:hypothetical protein
LVVVHHHPGRIRVRAERFLEGEGGKVAFAQAQQALEGFPEIHVLVHNPHTGSVLIEYEVGSAEPNAILSTIALAVGLGGVVDQAQVRVQHEDPARVLIRATRKLDGLAREVTGGRAGLNTLVPGLLAMSGVVSFLRRPVALRWDNLLYWSYTVFRDLNWQMLEREGPEANEPHDLGEG